MKQDGAHTNYVGTQGTQYSNRGKQRHMVACLFINLALSLSICVPTMHVPPLIYIAMDCIMLYVFGLRVFKQMDAHARAGFH